MYEPQLRTTDLWHGVTEDVGGHRHCHLIDVVSAVENPDDEELLMLLNGGHRGAGHTEKEVGDILGISQQAVSYRFQRILRRARDGAISKARSISRGTDLPRVLRQVRVHGPVPGATDQPTRSELGGPGSTS